MNTSSKMFTFAKFLVVLSFLHLSILSAATPQVSAGVNSSFYLHSDGSLWAWGRVQFGQLGNGFDNATPKQVGNSFDWATISAGDFHTLALKENGSLWSCGLINGETIPTQISNDRDWKKISAGYQHSLAIKNNGTLWAWGYNNFGELGTGSYDYVQYPTQIGSDNDWTTISSGMGLSVARKDDGSLWIWGKSLGNRPTKVNSDANWKKILAGRDNIYAIKSDGTLWMIFKEYQVQIGNESNWKSLAQGNGREYILAINENCTLYNIENQNTLIEISRSVISAASGRYHYLMLKKDGTLWAAGYNNNNQLGDGSGEYQSEPIQIHLEQIEKAPTIIYPKCIPNGKLVCQINPKLPSLKPTLRQPIIKSRPTLKQRNYYSFE